MEAEQVNTGYNRPVTGVVESRSVYEVQDEHVVSVPHVRQHYSWDCGLACVSMILKMFNKPCDDVYKKDLEAIQCGQSVWTIDLAYILSSHNVNTRYFTTTIGVKDSHHSKAFYRSSIQQDAIRVNKLFEGAEDTGISVENRNVSVDEMLNHLQTDNPYIVLVDWSVMRCEGCGSKLSKCCWSCISCHAGAYQGHYIVVCGFNRSKGLIYYKNPDARSCNDDFCTVDMSVFDKARGSDGTDDDVLFIYRSKSAGDGGDTL